MAATQNKRTGRLATELGEDKLLLSSFEMLEAIGDLFSLQVTALSEDGNIQFDKALGKRASVHLHSAGGLCPTRDFSGVVTEAQFLGTASGMFYGYNLTIRPWLWLLSLASNCRIFPFMTPNKIIQEVLKPYSFKYVDETKEVDEESGKILLPNLEYCTQYRETDLNFVLRLMEEFGIYYYFKFDPSEGIWPSDHQLILRNGEVHDPLPSNNWPNNDNEFPFNPKSTVHSFQEFETWRTTRVMASSVYTLNDYDYVKPTKPLKTDEQPLHYGYGNEQLKIYDYPGRYKDANIGAELAQHRWDADCTRDERRQATGYAPSLTPGYTFTRTTRSDDQGEDGKYLVVGCVHIYSGQTYESSGGATSGKDGSYRGRYEFQPAINRYRMPRVTLKPVIVGTQSGKVVGAKDQQEAADQRLEQKIDVDELARILVEFYWDREGNYPEHKGRKERTCRVRVAQMWAGLNHGMLFVPRIGDEVLVTYEEGDPDRPIVVGSVYNGDNKPKLELPNKKTRSGIRTCSSEGGGDSKYNMLLFDDTKGDEHVKLRSQKELMFKALGNEQRDIGGSQTENVGGDETITVGGPTGGGTFSLTAWKKIVLKVGPNTLTIDQDGITLDALMIMFRAKGGIESDAAIVTTRADGAVESYAPLITLGATGNVTVSPILLTPTIHWNAAAGPPPAPG